MTDALTPEPRLELRKQLYPRDPLRLAAGPLQEKMLKLYRTLLAQLPGPGGRVVLLLGLGESSSAMRVTRELAKTVALKLNKRVLLFDATPHATQLSDFSIFPNYNWHKAYRDGKPVSEAIYQLGDSSLYVSQISREIEEITEIVDSPLTPGFLATLKQVFDLIAIDAAPASKPAASKAALANSIALAGYADGVLLVIESEKTRWQQAAQLKNDVQNQGGRVLGTVLSNRRYYIPQFLYDRL